MLQKILNSAIFFLLSITCFNDICLAEKDPKASKETPEVAQGQTDPLKVELKDGEVFNCEADIFYEWETLSKDKESKKSKVFFQTLVERGKDGNLTKSRLESRLVESKTAALSQCKTEHNVSECTNKKISSAKSELRQLDFQTRRTMTSNIIETCENLAGNCLESSSSEIRCQVYRSPDSLMKKEEATGAGSGAAAAPAKK